MFVNQRLREINLKIVYYGPPLSGKTTNLQWIHSHTRPEIRSDLVSLKTRQGRTLFFDFMQIRLEQTHDLKPKLNLYTVAGQVHYKASLKLVLQGTDGIVFVADSQAKRIRENVESMGSLREILSEMGHNPDTFPMVLQYNKQDLPHALPAGALTSQLAHNDMPHLEAVAIQGRGVFETLEAIINLVLKHNRVHHPIAHSPFALCQFRV
jgi:signal recognition particle receptor subunit beta